jgi:hypothetical protein
MSFAGQRALDVIARRLEQEKRDQFLRWLLSEFNFALNHEMAEVIADKARRIYERTGE